MPNNVVVKQTVTMLGRAFSVDRTLPTTDHAGCNVTLPRAKTGSLGVRTDNTTGTITGEAAHGVTTGAKIDIFWVTNGVPGSRRGVTVGVVAGASIPISLGSGDNLPPVDAALTLMVESVQPVMFVGANAIGIGVSQQRGGWVQFTKADDTVILAVELDVGEGWNWDNGSGLAHPLAASTAGNEITKIKCTHKDGVNTGDVVVTILY